MRNTKEDAPVNQLNKVASKTHRWIDLIVALLRSSRALTFAELAKEVPGYGMSSVEDGTALSASVKRMFERDKKDLRDLGLPLETIGEDGDENTSYTIKSQNFYLPYLKIAGTAAPVSQSRVIDQYGYRGLVSRSFEPDELIAIANGIERVLLLEDPLLIQDVKSAAGKLAFDLPVFAPSQRLETDSVAIQHPKSRAASEVIQQLVSALNNCKEVQFTYHTMADDEVAHRKVQPYGLFFQSSHWYLVGFDLEKEEVRNFRASRISNCKTNPLKASTPDYKIPRNFHLKEHARSRQTWELGDGEVTEGIVRFVGDCADLIILNELGEELQRSSADSDGGTVTVRRFSIRRTDAFSRWLLSLGGEARPLEPASLVSEFRALVTSALAIYGDDNDAVPVGNCEDELFRQGLN